MLGCTVAACVSPIVCCRLLCFCRRTTAAADLVPTANCHCNAKQHSYQTPFTDPLKQDKVVMKHDRAAHTLAAAADFGGRSVSGRQR